METSRAGTTAADDLYEIVKQVCIARLDLLDIIRISASSKALAEECRAQLAAGNHALSHQLLLQTVKKVNKLNTQGEFDGGNRSAVDKYYQAMRWLLGVAGSEVLLSQATPASAATAAAVFNTPRVPVPLVRVLVAAGLRISYTQLVDAARSSVQGIECWVAVPLQLGIATGLPRYVEDVCSYSFWASAESVAEGAPREVSLPGQLSMTQAANLLHIVISLCTSEVDRTEPRHSSGLARFTSVLNTICQHPAAQQIAGGAVAQLLERSLRFIWSYSLTAKICSLPGAKKLDTAVAAALVVELLEHASKDAWLRNTGVMHLLELPGVQQLSVEEVCGFLQQAVDAANPVLVEILCCVPAAKELDMADVQMLIKSACTAWPEHGESLIECVEQDGAEYTVSWAIRCLSGLARELQLEDWERMIGCDGSEGWEDDYEGDNSPGDCEDYEGGLSDDDCEYYYGLSP